MNKATNRFNLHLQGSPIICLLCLKRFTKQLEHLSSLLNILCVLYKTSEISLAL